MNSDSEKLGYTVLSKPDLCLNQGEKNKNTGVSEK